MTLDDPTAAPPDTTPPLKRHAALQPLSREHMSGLIQARNLQLAASQGLERRRRAIDDFVRTWRTEICEHFDDEERLLLPLTESTELRHRLLDEHAVLRGLAARCEADPDAAAAEPELARRLGVLLHDHIRWEEREFFEAVQRGHPEALARLTEEAVAIEKRRPGSRARTGSPPNLTDARLVAPVPESSTAHTGATSMTDARPPSLRQPPAERFASDHLLFDLHAEIAALRAEGASSKHGHRQETLYKHAGRTMALFVLDVGGALPEHAAAGVVTVQAIEGELEVTVAGEPRRLAPGTLLAMAPGVRHDVRARGSLPAAFLLQVSLPGDDSAKR